MPRARRGPRLSSNGGCDDAGDLPRRPESGPARGCPPHRRPRPRHRGSGFRQDARPHAPHRAPARRCRRQAARDPRDHVHEQGGGGDARARHRPRRPAGARGLGDDLPLGVWADPAPRGGAARLPLELHDLRLGRPGATREALPRGARARPEALHAARHPLADLEREEPPRRTDRVRRARRELLRPDRRRGLRPLPEAPLRLERGRLRRHALPHGRRPRALPRGAAEVAGRVPLRPRRRVPGHEPRAVPAPPAARGEAHEPLRGR